MIERKKERGDREKEREREEDREGERVCAKLHLIQSASLGSMGERYLKASRQTETYRHRQKMTLRG
jgi:hypothetical protein